jgi:hypothetical protein
LIFLVLEILAPRENIDIARNWPEKTVNIAEREREKKDSIG